MNNPMEYPSLGFAHGETIDMLRDAIRALPLLKSRRAPRRLIVTISSPPICGRSSATWVCSA